MRRSLLYIPGNDARKIEKAFSLAADSLIFDLEDSVSFEEKKNARKNVISFIKIAREKAPKKEIIVRINSLETMLGIEDIIALIPSQPDAILLPKACPHHVILANEIMKLLEMEQGFAENKVGLMLLIETAQGVETLQESLQAASKRICAIQLGAEDLTRDLGIKRTEEGRELAYARSRIIMAAHMMKIDAVDTPYVDFKNQIGLQLDAAEGKNLGMSGKACIHPAQLTTINSSFSPSLEEIKQAKEILTFYRAYSQKGKGAFQMDGKMIDLPIAQRAESILKQAQVLGLIEEKNEGKG